LVSDLLKTYKKPLENLYFGSYLYNVLQKINRCTRYINAGELLYRDAPVSQNRQTVDAMLADHELRQAFGYWKRNRCWTVVDLG
jgi:hypothetical protein